VAAARRRGMSATTSGTTGITDPTT